MKIIPAILLPHNALYRSNVPIRTQINAGELPQYLLQGPFAYSRVRSWEKVVRQSPRFLWRRHEFIWEPFFQNRSISFTFSDAVGGQWSPLHSVDITASKHKKSFICSIFFWSSHPPIDELNRKIDFFVINQQLPSFSTTVTNRICFTINIQTR